MRAVSYNKYPYFSASKTLVFLWLQSLFWKLSAADIAGYVAEYTLEDGKIVDSVTNIAGTLIGAITTMTDPFGRSGKAMRFPGQLDSYGYAPADTLPMSTPLTVSFWFYAETVLFGTDPVNSPGVYVLGYGGHLKSGCGHTYMQVINNLDSRGQLSIQQHCRIAQITAPYTTPPINAWHHWAYTNDGSTGKMYLDGNLTASQAGGLGNLGPTPLAFGTIPSPRGEIPYNDASGGPFKGGLFGVRFYDTALPPSDVKQLFELQPTPSPTSAPSVTATKSPTISLSATGSSTRTLTSTSTATLSASVTDTSTSSSTVSATVTPSVSATSSITASATESATASVSATLTKTASATGSVSATAAASFSSTASVTTSATETLSSASSLSSTTTPSFSAMPSASATSMPSSVASASIAPSFSVSASSTPSASESKALRGCLDNTLSNGLPCLKDTDSHLRFYLAIGFLSAAVALTVGCYLYQYNKRRNSRQSRGSVAPIMPTPSTPGSMSSASLGDRSPSPQHQVSLFPPVNNTRVASVVIRSNDLANNRLRMG